MRKRVSVNVMLRTFPKDFSQVAISQGYFPKWQLPKGIFQVATFQICNIPSVNFPSLSYPQRPTPYPVLAAVLGPLSYPSRSAWPQLPPVAPQKA